MTIDYTLPIPIPLLPPAAQGAANAAALVPKKVG
jgi:hypothetical protein